MDSSLRLDRNFTLHFYRFFAIFSEVAQHSENMGICRVALQVELYFAWKILQNADKI